MLSFYLAHKALPAPGRVVCGKDERGQLWLVTFEGNDVGEPRWSHDGFLVHGITEWRAFENIPVGPVDAVFSLDASEVVAALQELTAAELPPEVGQRLIGLVDLPAKLFRLKQGAATGARSIVRFEPSDLLRNLLIAVRTGNFEDLVVE